MLMPRSESIRLKVLWLFLAVSCFAVIEPSPYEVMFFVSLIAFASGGVYFDAGLAPLIFVLFLFDGAALIALIPHADRTRSLSFTFITMYITFTTIFFASLVQVNPHGRMKAIRSGYTFAAMVAAILGLLGYFGVPNFELFTNGRATGPFKDPNVFGPFLVPPIAWLVQDLLLARAPIFRTFLVLIVLCAAVFLSFSRGAIIDLAFTLVLVFGLTFVSTRRAAMRARTLLVAVTCVGAIAAFLVIVLSVPSVRELAMDRATLVEPYDSGEQGRFGNQKRSVPMLLELPLGFGPELFGEHFPQDPHEVFLSAFASFGWAGGILFAVFVAQTLYVGLAFTLRRSKLQAEFIGVFASAIPQLLQGVQIDTMHWRHLFMLFGCLYGLAAVERRNSATAKGAQPLHAGGSPRAALRSPAPSAANRVP